MPNPLYNEMQKNAPNHLETVFGRFMNQFKGQNPTAIINQMVQYIIVKSKKQQIWQNLYGEFWYNFRHVLVFGLTVLLCVAYKIYSLHDVSEFIGRKQQHICKYLTLLFVNFAQYFHHVIHNRFFL